MGFYIKVVLMYLFSAKTLTKMIMVCDALTTSADARYEDDI